uniref:RING-type E3 ubiquitin transferase n=1 Tax=Graphocephala atropunctata TaxID=36148 RepID=A0A1B6M9L2_9HEMI
MFSWLWESKSSIEDDTTSSTFFTGPTASTGPEFKVAVEESKALDILLRVLKKARCSRCKRVADSIAQLCSKGHILCSGCEKTSLNCSTCGPKLSLLQLPILDSFLRLLPRECRNYGCPKITTFLSVHQEWCEYQESSCKFCNCSVNSLRIMSHLQSEHPDQTIILEGKSQLSLRNFHHDEAREDYTPIYVGGQFLWGITRNCTARNEFIRNFELVPKGKPTSTIHVKLIFGEPKSGNFDQTEKDLTLEPWFKNTGRNEICYVSSQLKRFTDKENLCWEEEFTVSGSTLEHDISQSLEETLNAEQIQEKYKRQISWKLAEEAKMAIENKEEKPQSDFTLKTKESTRIPSTVVLSSENTQLLVTNTKVEVNTHHEPTNNELTTETKTTPDNHLDLSDGEIRLLTSAPGSRLRSPIPPPLPNPISIIPIVIRRRDHNKKSVGGVRLSTFEPSKAVLGP